MIKARLVIELMGSPKEHIVNLLNQIITKMKGDKDLNVIKETINEPKEVKEFWSNFADIEIEIVDLGKLIDVCFDYMPSSVEINEPEKLDINHRYATGFINDLLARLHKYDMLLKNFYAENKLLKSKMEEKK